MAPLNDYLARSRFAHLNGVQFAESVLSTLCRRITKRAEIYVSAKMNLDAMSVDEIWQLHEEISGILSLRLTAEKRELEKRLAQLAANKRCLNRSPRINRL